MSGRERIEQAAKENGWETKHWARNTAAYLRANDEIWVAYTAHGKAAQARYGTQGVPKRTTPDQVIAYLQQHGARS
ncbi:hypothetical protein PROPHICCUG48898T2_11 [Mycobacterium phage CCUG48898T-2]|nr:hypothetical protein PROPHICCUG48898T2_11 [Mycobacterium phage CCUG48898T-2]